MLFLGTNLGRFVTLKLLPEARGGFTVKFISTTSLDQKVISISPIHADSGAPANATQEVVASLRDGYKINGVVLVATQAGVKVFKPSSAKGAHKSWDEFFCDSAGVVRYQAHGYVLVGLFGDGCAKAYSIPSLKEIASTNLSHILDVKRFPEALITPSGDILGWTGPSEIAMLNVWGTGNDLYVSSFLLGNKF